MSQQTLGRQARPVSFSTSPQHTTGIPQTQSLDKQVHSLHETKTKERSMSRRLAHDAPPPPNWPEEITYLSKPRLSPCFTNALTPLLLSDPSPASASGSGSSRSRPSATGRSGSTSTPTYSPAVSSTFKPCSVKHPSNLEIKRINQAGHPAHGQNGLFAKGKIKGGELLIPYLGIIHATTTPDEENDQSQPTDGDMDVRPEDDPHKDSDYDLSLLRLSSSDPRNPFIGQGRHVSIGVDAAKAGNAARFVNDFRGVKESGPNAEFRLGRGEGGELRMELWTLKCGIGKGDEVLVSYGKGWWGARR